MGKGDFGKTPSVWRPSELGGEVAPGLIGGDPWSSGIVTTTQFTEYSYPPAAALIPIPQPWHLFYQNKDGSLVTKNGAFPGGIAVWAMPTNIDFTAYPRIVCAVWVNYIWSGATSFPSFFFQVRNAAGTWLNAQSVAAGAIGATVSPKDIFYYFTLDVALGVNVTSQVSGASGSQVEGTAISGTGGLGTVNAIPKTDPIFSFATDELFADGDDGLGGFVQNTMRPAIQESRLAIVTGNANDITRVDRVEMWGTNAKGAFHGVADQSGRYPIGGGTAL